MRFRRPRKEIPTVNAGSMADIAFLLFVFFLAISEITTEKGVHIELPTLKEEQLPMDVEERNLLAIEIRTSGLKSRGKTLALEELGKTIKAFIDNRGQDANLSESPDEAFILLKHAKGTTFGEVMLANDLIRTAYEELWADYLQLTLKEYRALKFSNPKDKESIESAQAAYPYHIAEQKLEE